MHVVARSVGAIVVAVFGSMLLTMTSTSTAQAATVLTTGPLDVGLGLGNVMPYQLQGVPCRPPNVCREVPYLAEISFTAIPDGAELLNAYIATTSGPKIVFGYSEGAQVASKWMNQYGSVAGAPSNKDLAFLLIANPARKYGGYTNAFSQFAGLATPPNTQYQVIDLTRQYDFWSDAVTDTTNQLAMANSLAAAWLIHQDYTGVDLTDPKNVSWKEGNITYVVVPTKVLPLFIPLQWFGLNTLAEQLTAQYRPAIDSAYVRPAGIAEALAAALAPTRVATLGAAAKTMSATTTPVAADPLATDAPAALATTVESNEEQTTYPNEAAATEGLPTTDGAEGKAVDVDEATTPAVETDGTDSVTTESTETVDTSVGTTPSDATEATEATDAADAGVISETKDTTGETSSTGAAENTESAESTGTAGLTGTGSTGSIRTGGSNSAATPVKDGRPNITSGTPDKTVAGPTAAESTEGAGTTSASTGSESAAASAGPPAA